MTLAHVRAVSAAVVIAGHPRRRRTKRRGSGSLRGAPSGREYRGCMMHVCRVRARVCVYVACDPLGPIEFYSPRYYSRGSSSLRSNRRSTNLSVARLASAGGRGFDRTRASSPLVAYVHVSRVRASWRTLGDLANAWRTFGERAQSSRGRRLASRGRHDRVHAARYSLLRSYVITLALLVTDARPRRAVRARHEDLAPLARESHPRAMRARATRDADCTLK